MNSTQTTTPADRLADKVVLVVLSLLVVAAGAFIVVFISVRERQRRADKLAGAAATAKQHMKPAASADGMRGVRRGRKDPGGERARATSAAAANQTRTVRTSFAALLVGV